MAQGLGTIQNLFIHVNGANFESLLLIPVRCNAFFFYFKYQMFLNQFEQQQKYVAIAAQNVSFQFYWRFKIRPPLAQMLHFASI